MDIPIFPNHQAPKPREEVRIETLELQVYPDRFRVFVHVKVTPFLERPNLLMTVRDEDDRIAAELSVIETMHNDMEFTIHLRGKDDPAGAYTLTVDLYYETRNPPQDRRVEGFIVPAADEVDAQ
jgi:hypothetical protein